MYDAPRTLFVAGFIGDANILAGRVAASDDNRVAICLPSGAVVRARAADRLRLEDDAIAVVRPEHIRLTPLEDNNGGVEGILTEIVFQGSAIRARSRGPGRAADRSDASARRAHPSRGRRARGRDMDR